MERMEEMLDLFKDLTCVEFMRLRTEEEQNRYDYKVMIVHDEDNEGTCGGWSSLGKPDRNIISNTFTFYF